MNSCPMSFKQIDSNVSRLTSLLVASLIILYLFYSEVIILYIIALDFSIRLFIQKESSPLYRLAFATKELFNLKDKFIDSGSKRLAAYFGLLFTLLLIGSYYLDTWFATLIIAVVFLSCALLDVFFNFCIGCKIYYIIKKIYPSFMS